MPNQALQQAAGYDSTFQFKLIGPPLLSYSVWRQEGFRVGQRKEPCDLAIDADGFTVVFRGQDIGDIRWREVSRVEAANLDGLLLVRFSRTGSGGQCTIDSDCGGFERVMALVVGRLTGFPADWQERVLQHQPPKHSLCLYSRPNQALQQTAEPDSFS